MAEYQSVLETLDADFEEFRRRVRVRVRRAVRETFGEGTGGAAFYIIEVLLNRGSLSPSDLAATLEVRTSTMTVHLDRLEELRWAKREPASPGTNRILVAVTTAGRTAFERYAQVRRSVLADVLAPLAPSQVATLAQGLHTWVEAQRAPRSAAPEVCP